LKIEFYSEDEISERLIKYVTLLTFQEGKMVLVRHRERETWEFPGGHKEANESCRIAAERELYEETGAIKFKMDALCIFNVIQNGKDSFGKFYSVEIEEFGSLPDFEIQEVRLFDKLPGKLTYPEIQTALIKRVSIKEAF